MFLSASSAVPAQVEEASAARPAEYMIYQYPAVSLVVVIDTLESEFEAQVSGPEGALVSETGITSRRIGPVYQFVEAVDIPRQLMIEVNPSRRIERSRIGLELMQLPDTDRNSRALASAYRYLAHGMKRVHTDNNTVWAERTYSLRNAAQAFAALGMEEMRLWSEYYATHLILYEIEDVLLAMERARTIRAAARKAGYETIELTTRVLEADAMMMAGDTSTGTQSFERYESAHEAWEDAVKMAAAQGYEAERGRALYQDGMAYERQGRLDRAIERYEQALDVTATASDPELMNQIRATAAAAYETRGSTSGAISLLDDISGDLSGNEDQVAGLELASNLFEKGRLLNSTYRFAAAAVELRNALELQKDKLAAGQWGLVGLELAWSHYSMGYLETAEAVIRESLPRTPGGEKEALARAYGVLADISRERDQFEKMQEYRSQQAGLLSAGVERAGLLFDSAIDAQRRDGLGSAEAIRLFRQARQEASGSDRLTGNRAGLYLCLAELQGRGSSACDLERARVSYEALQAGGLPSVEIDSGLAWVRILRLKGRQSEARALMDELINSVQFYRERLPGSISTWYWSSRELLFQTHLDLAIFSSPDGQGDGNRLLLALDRVRQLQRVVHSTADGADGVRNLLARVEAAQPAPGDELSRQSHKELEAFRSRSDWSSNALTESALEKALSTLERGDSVLAYYFAEDAVFAVSARGKEVKQVRLSSSKRIRGLLESIRRALQDPGAEAPDSGLENLGDLLLAPLNRQLGQRIFLLPSGYLNGFPFDALRLDGKYLAEKHQLVHVESLSTAAAALAPLAEDYGERVFLAGNPRSGRDLFSYGVSTSQEISAVRDRFVGDGLHIVQGVALRSDELDDDRYANAALLHLAMPGRVDLAYPERSRLLLSGERETPATEFLSPTDLRAIGLKAQLVVLSGTSFTGRAQSDFDSRLGLVNDLQKAGARQVLASLWPAGDTETAAFMVEFYQRLETDRNASEALFQTRKARIVSENGAELRSWAGFQLFIR